MSGVNGVGVSGGGGGASRIPLPRGGGGGGGGGGAGAGYPLGGVGTVRRSASMRLRGEKAVGPRAAPAHAPAHHAPWRSAAARAPPAQHHGRHAAGGGGGDGPWALGGRLRSLSLSAGGGGAGGGGAFPAAPAASPEPPLLLPGGGGGRRGVGGGARGGPTRGHSLQAFFLDGGDDAGPSLDEEDDEEVDDGASSLRSFGSACSAMSCDHAYFARNGTTFSGRRMKYVVHCSPHAGEAREYLTPTQRAARQIRRLKALLQQAQKELNHKDQDIFRLTKEVVELRLFKAALGPDAGADARGAGGDEGDAPDLRPRPAHDAPGGAAAAPASPAPPPQQQQQQQPPATPPADHDDEQGARALLLHNDHASQGEKTSSPSLADSGHFEDIATTPEPPQPPAQQQPPAPAPARPAAPPQDSPRHAPHAQTAQAQTEALERRLAEAARDAQELKERHNDRVEALLQRLSHANDQYCAVRGELERAQERVRALEREAEGLRRGAAEQEERHKSMYLKMYMKGQEAARFEHADQVLEFAHKAPSRVSVPELLQQLQVAESELENMKETDDLHHTLAPKSALLTAKEALSLWLLGTRKAMYRRIVESRAKKGELDPEITLQFLKSAIYYFLTDKENHQGHLNAIESILGYNENEKLVIEKACRMYARK